jgi:hypothetical protein
MRSALAYGLLATTLALACAVRPAAAATGSWSPRSSAHAGVVRSAPARGFWTRAGYVHEPGTTSEITPLQKHRKDPPPNVAAAGPTLASRLTVGQQQERRSPSSARDERTHAAVAHLRTSSAPDRRARAAHLAMLAGVFYEAHAPPQPARTGCLA